MEPTPLERFGQRVQKQMAYLTGKPWFWVCMMAIPFSWPFYYAGSRDVPPPLMTYGEIPAFELQDQYGRDYSSTDLEGRVWVAAFFFTRCATVCPRLMEQMKEIQHSSRFLGHDFHIVGFSVDPDHDTPEVLAEYAKHYTMSRTGWTLLTGETTELQNITVNGFRVAMGRRVGTDHEYDGIFHGTHFVLVGRDMQIRGYYASEEEGVIRELLRDAGLAVTRGE
jgi:protein SCO1/2